MATRGVLFDPSGEASDARVPSLECIGAASILERLVREFSLSRCDSDTVSCSRGPAARAALVPETVAARVIGNVIDDVPARAPDTAEVPSDPVPDNALVPARDPTTVSLGERTPREVLSLARGMPTARMNDLYMRTLSAASVINESDRPRPGRLDRSASAVIRAAIQCASSLVDALGDIQPRVLTPSHAQALLTEAHGNEPTCLNPECMAREFGMRLPPMLTGAEEREWAEHGSVNGSQQCACLLCTIYIVNSMFIEIESRACANARQREDEHRAALMLIRCSPVFNVQVGAGGFRPEVAMDVSSHLAPLGYTLSASFRDYLPQQPHVDPATGRRFLPIDAALFESNVLRQTPRQLDAHAAAADAAQSGHEPNVTPAAAREAHARHFF